MLRREVSMQFVTIPKTPEELGALIKKMIPELEVHAMIGPAGGSDSTMMTFTIDLPIPSKGSFDLTGGKNYFENRNVGLLKELETLTKLMGGISFSPSTEIEADARRAEGRNLVPRIVMCSNKFHFQSEGVAFRMFAIEILTTFARNIEHICYGLNHLGIEVKTRNAVLEAERVARALQTPLDIVALRSL